jgi:hypothetical protein
MLILFNQDEFATHGDVVQAFDKCADFRFRGVSCDDLNAEDGATTG